jgi:hypothetical protein
MVPFQAPPARSGAAPPRPEGQPLRALRPPEEVQVLLQGDRPAALRGRWLQGRVRQCAGPWRWQRGWWDEPLDRDYYDLELSDGTTYRLFLDRVARRWFIDGVCG